MTTPYSASDKSAAEKDNGIYTEKIDLNDVEVIENRLGKTKYLFKEIIENDDSVVFDSYDGDEISFCKRVEYEFDFYNNLGLMDINIAVIDDSTDTIDLNDNLHAYAIKDDLSNDKLYVDYHGILIDANNILSGGFEITHISNDLNNEGDGTSQKGDDNLPFELRPSGYLPKVAYIGMAITSSSDAKTIFTTNFVKNIPSINEDPIAYFFHVLTIIKSERHYLDNCNFIEEYRKSHLDGNYNDSDLFYGYITKQTDEFFSKLKWGLGDKSIKETGCEIISVYNSLVDSGCVQVDLASLIMLFELCNADLLGGAFGALPLKRDDIEEELIRFFNHDKDLKVLIDDAFERFQYEIDKILEGNTWVVVLTLGTSILIDEAVVKPALKTIKEIIKGGVEFAASVVDYALKYTPTLGEMIRGIYGINSIDEYNSLDFESLRTNISKRKRMIISFWNEYDLETHNIIINSKLHTVFVTKIIDNESVWYVAKNSEKDSLKVDLYNLELIMGNDKVVGNRCLFVWGCVFND